MPESMARIWQRFRPLGTVDAGLRLQFDGSTWRPQLTATCRGISLTDMEKFPYVLEQTSGKAQETSMISSAFGRRFDGCKRRSTCRTKLPYRRPTGRLGASNRVHYKRLGVFAPSGEGVGRPRAAPAVLPSGNTSAVLWQHAPARALVRHVRVVRILQAPRAFVAALARHRCGQGKVQFRVQQAHR